MLDSPVVEEALPAAARALTVALTSLGDALARADLSGVLDAEPSLTTALAAVSSSRLRLNAPALEGDQAVTLVTELNAAREALARCAALGQSLDAVVRIGTLGTAGYDAAGAGLQTRFRPAFDQSM
jgi:hypothetical protein